MAILFSGLFLLAAIMVAFNWWMFRIGRRKRLGEIYLSSPKGSVLRSVPFVQAPAALGLGMLAVIGFGVQFDAPWPPGVLIYATAPVTLWLFIRFILEPRERWKPEWLREEERARVNPGTDPPIGTRGST